eukprot:UN09344
MIIFGFKEAPGCVRLCRNNQHHIFTTFEKLLFEYWQKSIFQLFILFIRILVRIY